VTLDLSKPLAGKRQKLRLLDLASAEIRAYQGVEVVYVSLLSRHALSQSDDCGKCLLARPACFLGIANVPGRSVSQRLLPFNVAVKSVDVALRERSEGH
jgi:hypothetical protein